MAAAVMVSPETHLLSHDGGTTYSVPWAAGSGYTAAADYPQPIEPLRILHMDADIVVVSKPAFLPTENTKLIKDSVRSRVESELIVRGESAEGLHVAHRLDWETSGLLVLARHKDAMRSLTRQFAERTIRKAYTADVLGAPPQPTGALELPLAADARNPPRQCVDLREGKGGGKPATTRWAVLPAAEGDTITTEGGGGGAGGGGGGGSSTDGGGGADGDADGTDVGAGDCSGGGGGTAAEGQACARRSTWPESGPGCNLAPTEISSRLHLWPESGRCHQLRHRTLTAAAHATTRRSRGPPTYLGRPSGPEGKLLRGARVSRLQRRRCHCLLPTTTGVTSCDYTCSRSDAPSWATPSMLHPLATTPQWAEEPPAPHRLVGRARPLRLPIAPRPAPPLHQGCTYTRAALALRTRPAASGLSSLTRRRLLVRRHGGALRRRRHRGGVTPPPWRAFGALFVTAYRAR